jgi:hypothetical protein
LLLDELLRLDAGRLVKLLRVEVVLLDKLLRLEAGLLAGFLLLEVVVLVLELLEVLPQRASAPRRPASLRVSFLLLAIATIVVLPSLMGYYFIKGDFSSAGVFMYTCTLKARIKL